MDPIRVYVGLESSSDPEKRADLAVQELVKMGAFNRKVLAVGTTTGTGWIDENAADPLEYMFNGDTAIVATQYSYLPSWLSFLVDKSRAKAAGVTLFDAVYAEWLKHPAESTSQAARVRREPRHLRRRGGVQRAPRHRQPDEWRALGRTAEHQRALAALHRGPRFRDARGPAHLSTRARPCGGRNGPKT